MYGKTLAATLLGLSALVAAQNNTAEGPQNTRDGQVMVHAVWVGNADGDLVFTPETINAKVGEMVQFQFYPQNHSVAQSSFANPCAPISNGPGSANGTQGFYSGFMPVEPSAPVQPVFTIEVKDENPIWFYCATGKHCQNGMVGVINPPNNPDRTLAKYKEAAKKVDKTSFPGAQTGGESGTDNNSNTPDNTSDSPASNTSAPSSSSSVRVSLAGLFVAAAMGVFLL